MKKLIALLLCLALCLPCFVVPAVAEETERETFTSEDYLYAVLEDGTAEILRYYGKAETLVIPKKLDGHVITSIGDRAFHYCASLTTITIPDSVTAIGKDAFMKCAPQLTVTVWRNSYAAQYCKDNGLNYNYIDANDWLTS